jgi:hypothetical protein
MRVKGVREMILDHGDHVLHVLLPIYFAFFFNSIDFSKLIGDFSINRQNKANCSLH